MGRWYAYSIPTPLSSQPGLLFAPLTNIITQKPLLHTLIFVIEMALTMRLITKFNSYYAEKPVLTTMITNAVHIKFPHRYKPPAFD
jgi:hypothetical protein